MLELRASAGRYFRPTRRAPGAARRSASAPLATIAVIGFPNTYRRILTLGSTSHAWIELHRLVEAYSRTVGARFTEIFAELETRFGFQREDPTRWPDRATIRAAAELLHARREALLERRRALVATRRRAKRAGRRGPPAPELAALERGGDAPAIPRVGVWGWARRRRGRA
ncbi:MAG: hypothetical protein H6713_39120 [Myxococcales bacterium]|nr:hypothetical protein [Myxococcales bacterium]